MRKYRIILPYTENPSELEAQGFLALQTLMEKLDQQGKRYMVVPV